ncbi:MAG TPA: ATP-binding protein [Alphaproteobacteria bacterium]|nr:ATP-binding protein [Alphaproteobacteria bacterium]
MSWLKYLSIKRYLPRSLFARSLLILTVPIVLTMAISTYIFFNRHWENMANRLAMAVSGEVSYLAEQVSNHPQERYVEPLAAKSLQHFQLNIIYIPEGLIEPDPVIYRGRGDLIKKTLARALNRKLHYPYRILVDTEEKWIQVQVQLEQGVLMITSPQGRLFSTSGYIFLFWMVGVSTILLVVAILFMRNQIRPIKRLAVAAERFGKGRDVPFFKLEGAREVRRAAKAFLGMRERIDRQIQQRTAMLAGVSHDLRTPLTRMKLQAEMMGDNEDAKALKSDIADMEKMIDAYLQFAKGEGNEVMERVNILDVFGRLIDGFKRQGFVIELKHGKGEFELVGRPVALERCLSNILANAQKYAKAAWVSMNLEDEHIIINIEDDGPGIKPEHYEDVFKPFFREEKSRNIKTGGVGLGMPIALDIILAHGGNITLGKSAHGGLKVRIDLPV